MKSKISNQAIKIAACLIVALVTWRPASAQSPAPKAGIARAPQAIIDQHLDPKWVKQNMLDMLDHWRVVTMSNGFIQENLDRLFKPWGTQREASLEGETRQMYGMVIGYEYSQDKRYLDTASNMYDFVMKMHDDQYGGYYNRVTPDLKVLDDTKTSAPTVIFAFANAYRVTKDPKYLKAAMDQYQLNTTGKLAAGGSMNRDFSGPQASPYQGLMHHTDVPDYTPNGQTDGPMTRFLPAAGAGRGAGRAGAAPVRHTANYNTLEAYLDLYEATHSKEVWAEITAELNEWAKIYDYNLGYMPGTVDENYKAVGTGIGKLPPSVQEGPRFYQYASVLSRAVQMGADPKFIEMGSRSIDLGLKLDYNKELGGSGGFDPQGRPTIMFWWGQCELLKALGLYASLHGRSDLWPYYDQTLAFIKKNYVDTEYGGWFEGYVPGWTRAQLAEKSTRAYIKGALDGAELGVWHETSMFKNLLTASQPH